MGYRAERLRTRRDARARRALGEVLDDARVPQPASAEVAITAIAPALTS